MWREFEYELEDEFEAEAYDGGGRHDGGEAVILHNPDRRVAVTDALTIPFRFICCLELVFVNPASGEELPERGSGTLISDRHVLTAAHNVLDDQSSKNNEIISSRRQPFPTEYLNADRILVIPARHNRDKPVWFSGIAQARVAPAWQAAANRQAAAGNTSRVFADAQADFALLTLSQPLGAQEPVTMALDAQHRPLGFWGHPRFGGGTRIIPRAPAELRNAQLNLSGYPIDRCPNALSRVCPGTDPDDPDLRDQGSTQWRSFGNVVSPAAAGFPAMITYDMDTAPGQSGGPVWLNWKGFRNLIAINTTGFPRATAPFDIIANMGVRITEPVLKQLRAWMRMDGVSATF